MKKKLNYLIIGILFSISQITNAQCDYKTLIAKIQGYKYLNSAKSSVIEILECLSKSDQKTQETLITLQEDLKVLDTEVRKDVKNELTILLEKQNRLKIDRLNHNLETAPIAIQNFKNSIKNLTKVLNNNQVHMIITKLITTDNSIANDLWDGIDKNVKTILEDVNDDDAEDIVANIDLIRSNNHTNVMDKTSDIANTLYMSSNFTKKINVDNIKKFNTNVEDIIAIYRKLYDIEASSRVTNAILKNRLNSLEIELEEYTSISMKQAGYEGNNLNGFGTYLNNKAEDIKLKMLEMRGQENLAQGQTELLNNNKIFVNYSNNLDIVLSFAGRYEYIYSQYKNYIENIQELLNEILSKNHRILSEDLRNQFSTIKKEIESSIAIENFKNQLTKINYDDIYY